MKKQIITLIIVLLIIIIGLIFLVPNKAEKPIKIGVVTALSGDFAVAGESMKNSILMAIDDMELSEKVDIIFEDNRSCVIADTVSAIQKLVNVDKVDAIIGPVCTSETLAIKDFIEDKKIIAITPTATGRDVIDSNTKFLFRTIASDSEKSKAIANLIKKSNYRKVALLCDISNDAFIQQRQDFKDIIRGSNVEIILEESFKMKDTDFRSQLTKVKGSSADVVVVEAFPNETGLLMKQAKELGINLPFMSTESSVGTQDLITTGGNAVNGLIFPFAKTPTNKEHKEFESAYKEKFGKEPFAFASYESYDATILLLKAIEKSNREPEDIRKKLYETGQNYYGASGLINFTENGDVQKPMLIKIVKDGEFVLYEE